MAAKGSSKLIDPAIRIATAGACAAIFGPLGAVTGAFVGGMLGHVLGDALGEVTSKTIEGLTEKAGEAFLDKNSDALIKRLKDSRPTLEAVYREALRLSLTQIHERYEKDYSDWFDNWNTCLSASAPLRLEDIQPSQLTPEKFDERFRSAMQRLDAQGTAISTESTSIRLKERPAPEPLLAGIKNRLPEFFENTFRELIVQPEQIAAWNRLELDFRDWLKANITGIAEHIKPIPAIAQDVAATREDVAAIRKMLEERRDSAQEEGRIPAQEPKDKDSEISRLTQELLKLQEQVAARSSEPPEAVLLKLLEARDLDGALHLKLLQVQDRREEARKLPRDLVELGTIHELRFEWPQALDAYREAWELGNDPEHGFSYAYLAQKLNRFKEAIAAYEDILRMHKDAADRATTLNNLANLYRASQRMTEAEQLFGEALSNYRKLAEASPSAYLPYVAGTLNNLAILYRNTKRTAAAEEAYDEALAKYRKLAEANPNTYLPDVAMTLNNLAVLYRNAERMAETEEACNEALAIHRKFAEANPDAYLPLVAATLNNLGVLYGNTRRTIEAEEASNEALAKYRKLAQANPDAYLSDVAMTLNNLALLYSDTQRMAEAEEAYDESLANYRKLAEANPDAYLPYVAIALNNLAILFSDTNRMAEAKLAFNEAQAIRSRF